MGLYIIPKKIIHLINIIVCIICPAIKTHNLLLLKKEKINEENLQYIHFLTYWILYSFYSYMESVLIIHFMNYIPFYYEIKLILFFWLYSDTFQGAGYLYFKFIEKNYIILDKKISDLIENKLNKNITSFFNFDKSNNNIHNKIKTTVSKKDLYSE
ncbi:HVA22-like protein, putative [Plasmodium gallinaceum]|uniref:HVA22-like protein, putative n=1 Tax=Plasmodium gallinaceum TaxID=5849 RepID=A0A1J1GN96_PLAGA|nr:HVA22-like protein, putative [Plasmodium gallinaceum]CRG93943.1 HVA22-like protein, putative [Plasmodium gallinaceum]